jgi:hypothetical protein
LMKEIKTREQKASKPVDSKNWGLHHFPSLPQRDSYKMHCTHPIFVVVNHRHFLYDDDDWIKCVTSCEVMWF